jgi:hypothetical protein
MFYLDYLLPNNKKITIGNLFQKIKIEIYFFSHLNITYIYKNNATKS